MPGENSTLNLHQSNTLGSLNMEMISEFSLKGDHSVVDASIVDESSIVDASVVDSSLLPQLQDPHHHQQLGEYRIHSGGQHNPPKSAIDSIVNHHHSTLPDSHVHSLETTTIDGVVYNSRGYEVCGQLNQHNKPCQRIGKCPFHSMKDGKKSPSAESSPNISPPPPPEHSTEKKDKTPMKTPYKQGWTKDEHIRFLNGLQIHGKGAWKEIAMIVNTRTPTQIQSHAQKYYLRQKQSVKNKRSIHDITIEDVQDSMDASMRGPPHKTPHVALVPNGSPNINNRPPLQYSYTSMIPSHNHSGYPGSQPMQSSDPNQMYFSQRQHHGMQAPMVDQHQYSNQMRSPQNMQTIHMQSLQSMGMPQMQSSLSSMQSPMSSMQSPMSSMQSPMSSMQPSGMMSPMSGMQPMSSMQTISPIQSISSMQPLQTLQSIQSMPSAYSHIGGGSHSHLPSISQVSQPTQLPSMHYSWYQGPPYGSSTFPQHTSSIQNQMLQGHPGNGRSAFEPEEERHTLPSVRHEEAHKDYWSQSRVQANTGSDRSDEEDDNSIREKRPFPDFLTHDDHLSKPNQRLEDGEDDKEDNEDESNQFLVAEGDD